MRPSFRLLRKRNWLVAACVVVTAACSNTVEPGRLNGYWSLTQTWAGQVIITENTDDPQWPADPVTIHSATVRGDSLELDVAFGGGCRDHMFLLLSDGAWMESNPVQVGVRLAHDARGDNCKALVSRLLRFDLTPLKVAYNAAYQTTTGTIRINVRNSTSVTYSW